MARSPKEAGKMVDMPDLDKGSSGISPAGSNKSVLSKDMEEMDGSGTQTGSHPALRPQMLMCTGRIVRTIALADTLHRVVAQINEYRFVEKPYADRGSQS